LNKWSIPLVICSAISLVVFPVWLGGCSEVKTNWGLARVANLVEQDPQAAEVELGRVANLMADPTKDRDYWIVKLQIALKRDDSEQILAVARSAQESLPDYLVVPDMAFRHFYSKADYTSALQALLVLYSRFGNEFPSPEILNQIAYTRSMAVVELDLALMEINQALNYVPDSANFLDTRAWIHFQMGRQLDALVDAERAVQLATEFHNQAQKDYGERFFFWLNGKSAPASPDGLLDQTEAPPHLWELGVIRYHRGKILESLGRMEEAEKDWQWLRDHQLPQDERLR